MSKSLSNRCTTYRGVLHAQSFGPLRFLRALYLVQSNGDWLEIDLDRVGKPLLAFTGRAVVLKGRRDTQESKSQKLRVQSFRFQNREEDGEIDTWESSDKAKYWELLSGLSRRFPWGDGH